MLEGGHDLGETPPRTTFGDNSAPLYVWLRSGAWTVRKIRKRGGALEASQGLRLACPARSGARDTSRHIDLFASVEFQPAIARLRSQRSPMNTRKRYKNGNCQKVVCRSQKNQV